VKPFREPFRYDFREGMPNWIPYYLSPFPFPLRTGSYVCLWLEAVVTNSKIVKYLTRKTATLGLGGRA
jgi:hypothetical protein